MSEMPKVSAIIPVYNAAPYLGACLDSVLRQTLGDIEVICVDDGSTDGSVAILAEYAAKDPRIRTLRQQENSGQGAARNRGLEEAHGDYVLFVDADDELASADALARLSGEAGRERLDALFFDAETRADPGIDVAGSAVRPKDYIRTGDYAGVYRGTELLARFLKNNEYCVSPCLVLLNRRFLADCREVRFPAMRIFYEDNIFMTRVMLAAARTSHRPWRLYLRKVHAGSTVTSKPTARHLAGYRACYDDVCGLLARPEWDARTRLALMERKMVYLRQIRRQEGRRRTFAEWLLGLYVCLRCRGLAYIAKRAVEKLCQKFR